MKNGIVKYLLVILTAILVSCFFFPFEFAALPGLNTKKVLAALGVVVLFIKLPTSKSSSIDKGLLYVCVAALIVSLIGFISCVYNNTSDYVYASYFISFAVWTFAAYFCSQAMEFTHGKLTPTIICNYLIAVCVIQCILALMIDMIPAFKTVVDKYIVNIFDAAEKKRMYGIGASLDVAGTRFAAVLIIIIATLTKYSKALSTKAVVIYFSSFSFITIVGNMIGRTTTVGVALSLLYLCLHLLLKSRNEKLVIRRNKPFEICLFIMTVFTLLAIILYHTNEQIQYNLRFGFEGFFSLIETGHWQTTSNDSLMHMWIWPESIKTWIIGDGYFGGAALDPNFLGNPKMTEFYMGTDVGYCRFIFYFGVLGLVAFMAYFIVCGIVCSGHIKESSLLFSFLVLLNFIIWVKVSSDIFPVFAIFLCLFPDDQYE